MAFFIDIQLAERDSKAIKLFELKEWQSADLEHFGRVLREKKEYKFVAKNGRKTIVGTVTFTIQGNVAYLEGVLVDRRYRGQKIGTLLMRKAESFAKDAGCTKIWLETDEDWGAAVFYKKLEYKVTGTHENHFFGKRGLILTKFFDTP